jgi:hypothetical protein
VALFAAAPAMATVTSSTITSVTTPDGFTANPVGSSLFSGFDYDAFPTTTVSGTIPSDADPSTETVDVRCYYGEFGV